MEGEYFTSRVGADILAQNITKGLPHAADSPDIYRVSDFAYLRRAGAVACSRHRRCRIADRWLLADDDCLGLASGRRDVPGSIILRWRRRLNLTG